MNIVSVLETSNNGLPYMYVSVSPFLCNEMEDKRQYMTNFPVEKERSYTEYIVRRGKLLRTILERSVNVTFFQWHKKMGNFPYLYTCL